MIPVLAVIGGTVVLYLVLTGAVHHFGKKAKKDDVPLSS